MRRLTQAMATLIVLMVSAELSYARTTPAQKCAVAKNKAAAKKIVSKLKCNQTAISKGVAVDPACLTNTDVKFNTAIRKIEAAGGCAVTGDANAIEAAVDACVSNMVALTPVTTTTTTTTSTSSTTLCANSQPCCVNGAPRPAGFVCRPSVDATCDFADRCDGIQGECPFDRVAAPGTACTDTPPAPLVARASYCLAGRCVLSEVNQCREVNNFEFPTDVGCPTTACDQLYCSGGTSTPCSSFWPTLPPLAGTSCGTGLQCSSQGQCVPSSSLAQYFWEAGAWGSCTAGTQTRPVACLDETGALASDASCDPTTKPIDTRACIGG